MKRLDRLLEGVKYSAKCDIAGVNINSIIADSRLVGKDDLFVAICGTGVDGHTYVKEAFERGAAAALVERDLGMTGFKNIIVRDARLAVAALAKNFYADPSRKMKVVGITGTNGKTTTSYLLDDILTVSGRRAGVIGTIGYRAGREAIGSGNTTPSPLILQRMMGEMSDRLLEYCIIEVSSHALDQHRTAFVDFDIGVFMNATGDHLDYHKNFKNYLVSKASLFSGLKEDATAVINADDPNLPVIKRACAASKVMTFGLKKTADVCADNIYMDLEKSRFRLCAHGRKMVIEAPFIGEHNISNMLAAASCAIMLGVSYDEIKKGLEGAGAVPGRLQCVRVCGGARVFVDYAHTDDGLRKALEALRCAGAGRIITIFGCGGDRDKTKRPRMAETAADLSDYVIVTSDNPRSEDPRGIAADILKGFKPGFKDYKVVLDRRAAIEGAVAGAEKGDTVLIAGKGHEKYQISRGRKIPFDDVLTVKSVTSMRKKCSM